MTDYWSKASATTSWPTPVPESLPVKEIARAWWPKNIIIMARHAATESSWQVTRYRDKGPQLAEFERQWVPRRHVFSLQHYWKALKALRAAW